MPHFRCQVKDLQGRTSVLIRFAENAEQAASQLSREGYFPISIEISAGGKSSGGRLGERFVLELTSSLAIMLDSGLTLKEAVNVAGSVAAKPKEQQINRQMSERLSRGDKLHEILASWGRDFSPLYCGLVRIGEKSGNLSDIFVRLREYLTQKKELRDRMLGAMLYPMLVIFAALVGTEMLAIFVLPAIKNFFSQMGQNLPEKLARILDRLDFFTVLGIAGPLVFIGIVVVLWLIQRSRGKAAAMLGSLMLKIPYLGSFIMDRNMLNFLFAMEILISNGMTVEEALIEAELVVDNQAVREAIRRVAEEIQRGMPFSAACARESNLPPELSRWVSISEKTGAIETVFSQLKQYYQKEVDKKAARIMSLIEPALIIGVGVFMLLIIIVFILPIFSVYEVFL